MHLTTRLFGLLLLAPAFAFTALACGGNDENTDTTNTPDSADTNAQGASDEGASDEGGNGQTIVDIAAGNADFTTLVELVTAANLVETLSGTDEYTVFAPTNAAFAAFQQANPDAYAALGGNVNLLTRVLLYHVVAGKAMAATVISAPEHATVQGEMIAVSQDGGAVKINDATVVTADLEASNGVIHVIDAVLVPEAVLSALSD